MNNVGTRGYPWQYLCMTIDDESEDLKELILDFTSGSFEILKLKSIAVDVRNYLIDVLGDVDFSIFSNELTLEEMKDLEEKINYIKSSLKNKKITQNTSWEFFYDELDMKTKKIIDKQDKNLSGDELFEKVNQIFYTIRAPFEKMLLCMNVLYYVCTHGKKINIAVFEKLLRQTAKVTETELNEYMELDEKKDYFMKIEKIKEYYNHYKNIK